MAEVTEPYRPLLDLLYWQVYRTAEQAYRLVEVYGDVHQMVVPRTQLTGTAPSFIC